MRYSIDIRILPLVEVISEIKYYTSTPSRYTDTTAFDTDEIRGMRRKSPRRHIFEYKKRTFPYSAAVNIFCNLEIVT
ncbi:hypothetical protein SERLA73DRAFT_139420 [Serpula lacrymans var. lacrymans S7.3]|uniref:Uncharacterized protein n=1 Tax=Serpula lacrymans var. lacrymans (strain S7.3) TaxID=936435 RepID=F8Q262_SERL3|nr:hypothetical protein SERLA73DRAFT_139420 [Serpula lacrymans var. lacrymans S7.3]